MLDDQLLACQNFLQVFLSNVNPDDQLPVKVSSTSICKVEVNGAVTDWIIQYLHQWSCPDFLITPLAKIILDEVRFTLNGENCPFFKADVNAYISFPLMQFVVRKVQDVCAQYKDPEKLRTVPLSDCILPTTTFATKNKRRQMEDRHVIINDVAKLFNKQNCQPVSYYAVFDGHNGIGAANYSATHLHQFLTESQFFPMFPEQALTDAFKLTDKNLLEKLDSQMTRSGTTAVVALLFHEDRMLYVAWVGDSEALISSKGRVQRLVEPHKADRPDEIERIKKCGGTVLYWQTTYRVNGQLAVSRSIGDADHKLCVISVPDIVSIQLEGDEDFIILACDGLWDCVEPKKAAKLVYDHVSSNPDKYEQTSQLLVEYAKEQGSGDNITTIVVFLTHPRNIKCCDIDMETATAESFSSNQNGATSYRPINNFDHDVDEDFGPETNVDNIDDLMSQPVPTKKSFLDSDTIKTSFAEQLQNDVLDHHVDAESKNGALEEPVKEIIDNGKAVLDEESEEEEEDDEGWDYFKAGSNSKPTNLSQQKLESSGDLSNEMEHTLNPEAREFVPVSPTNENAGNSRSSSPEPDVLYPLKNAQELLKEEFIASSPMKGQEKNMDDVIVPSLDDFANEIKKRPSNILPRFVDTDDFSTNDVANHELNNGNAFEESFGQDSTYTSTRAVFGDESTFAKNLDDVNEELIEKQVKSDVTSALNGDDYESGTNGPVADSTTADNHDQPEQNHSDDFISGDVSAGDAFESEDFPSIVEKEQSSPIKENHHSFDAAGDIFENGTSNVTYGRDSGKYDAENEVPKFDELLMSSTEKSSSAAEHADVFGGLSFNKDPLDEVIYKMSNFDCAAADDRSWLTGDSSHNVSSPTHDLLNGTNPFAAANAHSNEEKENAEEKDISQPAATTKYDAFDTLAAASNDHVDFQSNVSRDPFQSVFGDDGVPAVAEKQPVEETITAEKVPETQAGIAVEDAQLAASATPTPNNDISAQILDTREYADQLHESEDTEIVPTTSENQVPAGGAETPVGSVDMETPYIHDCTRLGHKHDSVHEPVQKRHYDDLLPDEEDQDATKESDKLESELRESTGGKTLEFDLGFGGSNAASCNRTFGDNTGDEFQSLMCNLVTSKTTPAADASDDSKPSVPASISDNELTTSTYEQPADGGLVTPPPTAAASADPEVHVSIAEAVDKLAASRIQDDEKPAADSDTSIAAAAIAAGATAVGVAAVTAAVAAKKPEPPKKQSVIKKPEGAKPAPSKSTAQKTAAPKPTTSAAPKPAARTSLGSTATKKPALSATPTKSTVTSSRPTSATAPKPSTPTARTSLTASKSNSTTTASKPSPRPAAAKPLASPSKSARPLVGSLTSPRTAAAKPITNGDVTSSSATRTSTSTTRRVLPVTGAARKITSPTSSAPTKPAVNLATRTSLAPKPKTTTTTTTNTTTGTSADKKPIAKRPLSSISSRTTTINKDSKDSTNKRLSRPATASSVTKTLPKTESKVNTGFVKTNANAKKVSSADQTSNQIDSTKMNGNA